jgi:hypothetical protein
MKMENLTENLRSFTDYLEASKQSKNKVAFLTLAFVSLHNHAAPEDLESPFSRIAGIWAAGHKDTARVLQIIWKTSADGIVGSHLNYINAIICKDSAKFSKPVDRSHDHLGMKVI